MKFINPELVTETYKKYKGGQFSFEDFFWGAINNEIIFVLNSWVDSYHDFNLEINFDKTEFNLRLVYNNLTSESLSGIVDKDQRVKLLSRIVLNSIDWNQNESGFDQDFVEGYEYEYQTKIFRN